MGRAFMIMIVVALVAVGGAVVAFVALRGGAGGLDAMLDGPPPEPAPADFVAVDGARVLFVEGEGIAGPQVVRAMRRDGTALSPLWQSAMAGDQAAYAWDWRIDGERIVAEAHGMTSADAAASLELFDATRGHVLSVPGVLRGSWALVPGGDVAARTATEVVLVHGDAFAWHSPMTTGEYMAQLAASPRFVVLSDGTVHVFDRATGAEQPFAAQGETVGFASDRDEVLLRQGDAIAAVSLADGAVRTLNLGGPVVDDMDMPCLLGRHGDRWLVLFTTTMTQVFQFNGRGWSTPGQAVLAAIDPATGVVAWRRDVGNWEVACRAAIVDSGRLPTDDALPASVILRGARAEETGDMSGHLLAVDTESGSVLWESTYVHETHANAVFVRRGDITWMTIPETAEPFPILLVRFDGAHLRGAVRLVEANDAWTPALGQDAWVWGHGWQHLAGPELNVDASGPGATPVADVRASIRARLGLPDAAL